MESGNFRRDRNVKQSVRTEIAWGGGGVIFQNKHTKIQEGKKIYE